MTERIVEKDNMNKFEAALAQGRHQQPIHPPDEPRDPKEGRRVRRRRHGSQVGHRPAQGRACQMLLAVIVT
jgi:hypothetical protein